MEAGKWQTSSGAKSNSVTVSRRLSAGRLQKSVRKSTFRQMAAVIQNPAYGSLLFLI